MLAHGGGSSGFAGVGFLNGSRAFVRSFGGGSLLFFHEEERVFFRHLHQLTVGGVLLPVLFREERSLQYVLGAMDGVVAFVGILTGGKGQGNEGKGSSRLHVQKKQIGIRAQASTAPPQRYR